MIAILRHDDLREQPRCGDAALLQEVERRDDGGLVRLVALHILPANDAAAQEPCGLVVQLLGDLLPDVPPGFRCGGDLLGLDDFIHGRQMLRHTRLALPAWPGGLWLLVPPLDLSLQGAGACAGGLLFFCPVIPSLKQQHELLLVEVLAAFAKDAPDQQVHLFTQQPVLQAQRRVFLGESGFQRCHHALAWMTSRRCTNSSLS